MKFTAAKVTAVILPARPYYILPLPFPRPPWPLERFSSSRCRRPRRESRALTALMFGTVKVRAHRGSAVRFVKRVTRCAGERRIDAAHATSFSGRVKTDSCRFVPSSFRSPSPGGGGGGRRGQGRGRASVVSAMKSPRSVPPLHSVVLNAPFVIADFVRRRRRRTNISSTTTRARTFPRGQTRPRWPEFRSGKFARRKMDNISPPSHNSP